MSGEALALFDEYEKKEKCGLFGIWGPRESSQICYQGLFAQQHRGQESAGMVVSDGVQLNGHAAMGLVSQVFNPRMLREELAGHAAIGHVRYSTTGSSKLCNAQPLLRQYLMGPVAVAHNGNLINAQLLFLESEDPKKDISIYINSPGGSVYAGLAIFDTMNHIKPDVSVENTLALFDEARMYRSRT